MSRPTEALAIVTSGPYLRPSDLSFLMGDGPQTRAVSRR